MSFMEKPLLDKSNSKAKGSPPNANVDLTFSWISSILALGHQKPIDVDDLPPLSSANTVVTTFPILRNKLAGLHNVTNYTLAKALFLSAWKEILWTGVLAVLYTLARYTCPYFINAFLRCLSGGSEFKTQGYMFALIFCAATFLDGFLNKHMSFKLEQIGMRLRGAMTAMIFDKSLTLSAQSKQGQGSGELITLVSVDVENIDSFARSMHDPWLIVLQISLGLLMLYKNLGTAAFVALAATLSFLFANSFISKFQEKYQKNLMESRDDRMKMTTETLRNMRVLKFQGWEMSFLSKIFQLREVECLWLRKFLYNLAFMNFVFEVSTTFVALVTLGSCVLMRIPLNTGKILSSLAIFRVLEEPIYTLLQTISMLIQVKISFRRIASFLCLEELPTDSVERLPLGNSNTAIEIVDGNFSWDLGLPSPTLKDINLKVNHGMRVAICGKVGSGKSSLLSCILGEIPKISGLVKLCGKKAYVCQTPWIQSGTIQDNILIGNEIDSGRYETVLEACCLKKDLEIFAFGDHTLIGERGVNLSGGQKQRIQIARALYHDADIYLFDDPFSAVDAHTGFHLFEQVFKNLLRGKTVVYVTHQVEFLHDADIVLVMKEGRIVQAGKYDDSILISSSDFMELVGLERGALSNLETNEQTVEKCEEDTSSKPPDEDSTSKPTQIVEEEERGRGSVGFPVYWSYITTAYGGSLALVLLLGLLLVQIFRISSNLWLASSTSVSEDVKPRVTEKTLMIVYASLAMGLSFTTFVVDMLVATIGYITGTKLFKKMHDCLFRAPMSFFDATPSGRITSRCSGDQKLLDTRIPIFLLIIATAIIELLGVLGVMVAAAWQVLFVSIPIVFVCIWYQRFYITSARELSRLQGICSAPIVQFLTEAISGAITIRSFELQHSFQATYMKILDTYSRPELCASAATKWLVLRLLAFSSIIYASLLVFLVSFSEKIHPAMAGVAVTYGLVLNTAVTGLVWSLCSCETNMISVERIIQYMSIPCEAPLVIQSNRPDSSWPSSGEISITNLQVRYAPHMPVVLHGITCTFPGKMKTGIVGRTGSGKSTLIQALFRIVEPTSGQICIDGINILRIGLQDLRSKLGIIPQDPVMFQGTIRSNLDPLELYTDHEIWETLESQLGDEVRKMERKLDSEVVENGENWSMGQRQLVCLGRVLLKKSKILVLDEATASVDPNTDHLIQQTLKEHFSHCTIITIAHRMTSVLDSDMVLLLNDGVVEEFDYPRKLLENKSSSFAKLVAAWSFSHSKKSEMS